MGNDYDQRKKSKRLAKRAASDAMPDHEDEMPAAKKQRTKPRPKVRRLCRGPCYGEPGITAKDRQEAAEADAEEADPEGPPTPEVSDPALGAALTGDLRIAAPAELPKRMKLSTAVDLIPNPAPALSRRMEKKQKRRAAELRGRRAAAGAAGKGDAPGGGSAEGEGTMPASEEVAAAAVSPALAKLPEGIQAFMAQQAFEQPTEIQRRCWPVCLAGRDVKAVAQPGSGKTLGYLLPGAERLRMAGHSASSLPESPLMLVLAPTRELVQQVAADARALRMVWGLRVAAVFGGADRAQQIELLAKKPHLLVATPGRLLDLIDDGALSLGFSTASLTDPALLVGLVTFAVLDEADKMLSMGFEPQLTRLRRMLCPPKAAAAKAAADGSTQPVRERPQVLLFTATMPDMVAAQAAKWCRRAISCRVEGEDSGASISQRVVQVVQVCAEHKKPKKLLKHMASIRARAAGQRNPPRTLVFANRVKTARFVARTLEEADYRVALLHGDRSQSEREAAMRDFRSGKAAVMVATDVAARGLHIRGLPFIVNYDFPSRLEPYVHRVGRTGRLASNGHAFSFFTRNLAPLAQPLVHLLQEHEQAVDPNLVLLGKAYQEAKEKLGDDALLAAASGSDDEGADEGVGDARSDASYAEDLHEGLGLAARMARAAAAKPAVAEEADVHPDLDLDLDRVQPAPSRHSFKDLFRKGGDGKGGDMEGAAAAQQKPFLPSKKFAGARAGYVYKKGAEGVGYYIDAGSAEPVGGKQRGRARQDDTDAATLVGDLRKGVSMRPIGGAGAQLGPQSPAATSARKQQGQREQASDEESPGADPVSGPKGPPRARGKKGDKVKGDDTDSEDEGGRRDKRRGMSAGGGRQKALPGRIRKKLAMQRGK